MPNDEAADLREKAVHARFLAIVCLNDEMREELNAAARSFDDQADELDGSIGPAE